MSAIDDSEGGLSKSETARQLAKTGFEDLAQHLQRGDSKQLTAFLAAMGRFHRYSFGNVMLIIAQQPDATRVAGFRTWLSLGRQVRKGEKGIVIVAPVRVKWRAKERPGGNEDDPDESVVRFKATHVFDIAQTEGEPLPELARVGGDPAGFLDRLRGVVHEEGITLEERDDLGGAEGVSMGGAIHVRAGLSPAETFSVITHELAHELMHKVNAEERPTKTVRETEAEAVAHVVCSAVGLETNAAAADYIRLYRGDAETLTQSLDRIQKTAARIIEGVLEEGHTEDVRHAAASRERSR